MNQSASSQPAALTLLDVSPSPVPVQHEKFSSQLQLNHQRVVEGGAPRRLEVKEPEGGPAPSGDGGSAATPPEVSREEDKMAGQTSDSIHIKGPMR